MPTFGMVAEIILADVYKLSGSYLPWRTKNAPLEDHVHYAEHVSVTKGCVSFALASLV